MSTESPFDGLERENKEMVVELQSKQMYFEETSNRNKELNKEIIGLLSIKNELRQVVKQLK